MKRACALILVCLLLMATPAFADKVKINVTDSGFDRSRLLIQQGDTVKWNFSPDNQTDHEVRGPFFDSGPIGPGGSFSFQFTGAGKYAVEDVLNPSATMLIKIPVLAEPPMGPIDTIFLISMGNGPPDSYYWSVQYKYPGAPGWVLLFRQVGGSFRFKADHGPGTYEFRGKTHEFAKPDHTD